MSRNLITSQVAERVQRTRELFRAVRAGELNNVQLALRHGADANARDRKSRTPLMLAVQGGHETIVDLFLRYRARFNININIDEALIHAAKYGRTVIADLLAGNGANPSAVDGKGKTANMHAAARGHIEVVQLLLIYNRNPNEADPNGKTILMHAAQGRHARIVELLLNQRANVNAVDNKGDTALMLAAQSGDIETVRVILVHGANIDMINFKEKTALTYAAGGGHILIVSALLALGANANASNIGVGLTPLMAAAKGGHADVVQLLLDIGANVHAVDSQQDNALLYAAKDGDAGIVELILDQGADINYAGAGGVSALMHAAIRGHAEVVELLLERGVEIEAVDDLVETAFMYAVKGGHTNILELLRDQVERDIDTKEGYEQTLLMVAAENGHEDMIDYLLRNGANVNAVDADGESPFKYALSGGQLEIAEWLLDVGANANAANKIGHTALMGAASNGSTNLVLRLLNKGVDVNAVNTVDDHTAFSYASHTNARSVKEMAQLVNVRTILLIFGDYRLRDGGGRPEARDFVIGFNEVRRVNPALVDNAAIMVYKFLPATHPVRVELGPDFTPNQAQGAEIALIEDYMDKAITFLEGKGYNPEVVRPIVAKVAPRIFFRGGAEGAIRIRNDYAATVAGKSQVYEHIDLLILKLLFSQEKLGREAPRIFQYLPEGKERYLAAFVHGVLINILESSIEAKEAATLDTSSTASVESETADSNQTPSLTTVNPVAAPLDNARGERLEALRQRII